MTNYNNFRKETLKLNEPRSHKIKGSLGVYDAYKYIRKNKWMKIGRPLTEHEFYLIIRRTNKYMAEELSRGNDIHLPLRMGDIELRKYPTKVAIKDGKLVTNLPIDWDATLKLWYEDPESYTSGLLVRARENEVFKIYYNRNTADYTNKTFYLFIPNRDMKKLLTKRIRVGDIDAFTFKSTNKDD